MEDKWNDITTMTNMYNFIKKANFTATQIGEAQTKACSKIWQEVMDDGVVTPEEEEKFKRFLRSCNYLPEKDVKHWTAKLDLNHSLYDITVNDNLPIYNQDDVKIAYKRGEILHYAAYGDMMKIKTVTKRINYSGPSVSIRICKGVRYRVGSIDVQRKTESYWASESWGVFWISNMRIGFLGSSKAFCFPLDKIYSVSGGSGGLNIYKEGRSNPYIMRLSEYQEPCAIISNLINKL